MKIYGDENSSVFKNFTREPGVFFGRNDVLKGTKKTVRVYTYSKIFGESHYSETIEPKLHIHIPRNTWTAFTGKLRKYCLPWRWKTAYLDQEDGTQPRQILVCTSVQKGKLSDRLSKVIGKSWFVTNLINRNCYDEIFGQEFLRLRGQNNQRTTKISHPLGEAIGLHREFRYDLLCHIYRPRTLFSTFKYHLLKRFSTSWKEVAIQTAQISQNVLIKKADEKAIARSGLTSKKLIDK